ncbi:MAG: hypothetical protein ABI539_11915 [Acidobacteriota bacterium]
MRYRANNKTEADERGRRLLRSASISDAELDQISSGDHLFASVLERIQIASAADAARIDPRQRFAYLLPVTAAAALIAIAAIASSLLYTSRSATTVSRQEAVFSGETTELSGAAFVSISLSSPEAGHTRRAVSSKSRMYEQRADQRVVKAPALPPEVIPQFYAIGEISDPAEVARGGRIVRVGIPRASLFAMGVALPLENENALVTAELLVGQDGVTRAIRLVE